MKIVFLSFYNGEIERGVEVYVDYLATKLTQLNHEVTVYQNGPPKKKLYKTIAIGLPINWMQKSNEGRRKILPDYWGKLVGRFSRIALNQIDKDTDILIATNGSLQSLYARLWCIRNKTRFIISGQSGPGWDDRWNLYMFPNVFISKTKYQSAWTKNVNPFVRSDVIPNGVDLEKFNKKKVNIFKNLPRPIILTVGALVKEKRQDLLIKAVSKLDSGSLVIIGKGDEEANLRNLAEKLIPNRHLITNYPHEKMPEVYQSANLFTYPTTPAESFGIVLVEAMASGLPVVATDDPIRREIIKNAGLFADPENTVEYAKCLEEALKKNWEGIPRKQAEKYSWDRIALQYERLFLELTKND